MNYYHITVNLSQDLFRKPHKYKRRFNNKKNERRSRSYPSNNTSLMLLSFSLERLARELAHEMNDLKSHMQYRKLVRDYPADVLLDIKDQVLSRKDVKNRGAYFTTLVKLYDFNQNGDSRD